MAICPDCGREFYLEDEDELEVGDVVDCEECGAALEVIKVNELELASYSETEAEELVEEEEESSFSENDDDSEFEEISTDEFDENGYYGSE